MHSCMMVHGYSGPWWTCTEPSILALVVNDTRYANINAVPGWHGYGEGLACLLPLVRCECTCLAGLSWSPHGRSGQCWVYRKSKSHPHDLSHESLEDHMKVT